MVAKGSPSMGKKNKQNHIRCRRCGRHTYHLQKKRCSACGFPNSRLKRFGWQWKHPLTRERTK